MTAVTNARVKRGEGVEFGDFGRDLDTARRSEFFGFFNLVGSGGGEAPPVIVFRPSAVEMGRLVRLDFGLDGERLTAAELHIRRDFIEDPEQYPFAADITSSFLRAALRDAPAPEAAAAAGDIARYQPPHATARIFARSDDLLPSPQLGPTRQVLVYAGRLAEHRARIGGYDLHLANAVRDGERMLSVRITGAPPAPPAPSVWDRVKRRGLELVAPEATLERRLVALFARFGADANLRSRFLHDPAQVLRDAGLDPALLGVVEPSRSEDVPSFLRRQEPSPPPL